MATKLFSKKPILPSLLAALLLALAALPASAQEETNSVRYVVQPGDTLSSISVRFDISLNELIEANNLTDPNNLNIGAVLVIPGIDWIDGVLVMQGLPLGESYLSLKRRYLLSDEDMARLNRFTSTSPEQIYAGFQVMLATERGELTESSRAVVSPGLSLLELAAASGDNPWTLAAVNQLPGTWAALPGDVLFTPGQNSAGPGGLPSPITAFSVDQPGFTQGKTLVIRMASDEEMEASGEVFGHPLNFFSLGGGSQVALQGVPLEAESGTYDFAISGTTPDGASFSFSQPVRVLSGGYARASLFVVEELLDAQLSSGETTRIRELMTPVTEEKLWTRLWGWPHDLVNEVTSEFGVFRVYNGGLAESYHYGTDFGGGALLNIYAPAPGRVVFAGAMDVRGNATVIDHGWGVYTGYWHQEEIYVAEGDLVEPGEIIG
ncbi:MAG: LysM peptidoglycan-binding domain-containing protein, partial [Anaerolineales bacterium]